MTNNIGYIPTEEEVQKRIDEYNNRRSGPVLDGISKARGLERFLNEKSIEPSEHLVESIQPIGLDSDNVTSE